MPEIHFRLDLSPERVETMYRGARTVVVRAHDGRTVRFPASALVPHVRPEGVRGEFTLRHSAEGRLLALVRRR